MTGGAFGLEASLPALVVATIAGVGDPRPRGPRRGQIVPPMWARKALSAPAGALRAAPSRTSPRLMSRIRPNGWSPGCSEQVEMGAVGEEGEAARGRRAGRSTASQPVGGAVEMEGVGGADDDVDLAVEVAARSAASRARAGRRCRNGRANRRPPPGSTAPVVAVEHRQRPPVRPLGREHPVERGELAAIGAEHRLELGELLAAWRSAWPWSRTSGVGAAVGAAIGVGAAARRDRHW